MKNPQNVFLEVSSVSRAWAMFLFAGLASACSPPENFSEIDALLQAAVDRQNVVGVVAMAATPDEVIYRGAFGKQSIAADSDMSLNSIFRIASMTKPITSVAAMQLVEEGDLQLDSPVSDYMPEFDPQVLTGFDESTGKPILRPPASPVTVRHLLTHTSGFGYEIWDPLLLKAVNAGEIPSIMTGEDQFLSSPLLFDPGSRWYYGISTDVLGRLVEVVREKSLEEVFQEHIFNPLRMPDSSFVLPAEKHARFSAAFARQADGSLTDITRPPQESVTFYSGGGGLLSTAGDYVRFMQMMLRGGELDGVRILRADSVIEMGKNHIGELEAGRMATAMPEVSNDFNFHPGSADRFGLGFLLNAESTSGRSEDSLTWGGLFNTYFWIDPASKTCGVVMTQILPFYDSKVVQLVDDFESLIYARSQPKSSSPDSESDEDEIRAIRAGSNEAIRNHDAAAIVESFAESYQITTGSGALYHDSPEKEKELWAELFAERPDVIYVRSPDQVEISSYLPRAAESGTWVGNWTADNGPIELRGTYSASWIKVDGAWKIQSEMFVTLSCSGTGC